MLGDEQPGADTTRGRNEADMAIIPLTLTPWGLAGSDVWSGSAGGTYLGCVESFGVRYRARDAHGWWLGDYPSLKIASSIIEGAGARLAIA